jgi:hypothetical protein
LIHRRHNAPYLRGRIDGTVEFAAKEAHADFEVIHARAKDRLELEAVDAIAWAVFQRGRPGQIGRLFDLLKSKVVAEVRFKAK